MKLNKAQRMLIHLLLLCGLGIITIYLHPRSFTNRRIYNSFLHYEKENKKIQTEFSELYNKYSRDGGLSTEELWSLSRFLNNRWIEKLYKPTERINVLVPGAPDWESNRFAQKALEAFNTSYHKKSDYYESLRDHLIILRHFQLSDEERIFDLDAAGLEKNPSYYWKKAQEDLNESLTNLAEGEREKREYLERVEKEHLLKGGSVMASIFGALVGLVVLAILGLILSFVWPFITFSVRESGGKVAVVKRFGKIVRVVSEAGLHFKMPWDTVSFLPQQIKSVTYEGTFLTQDNFRLSIKVQVELEPLQPPRWYLQRISRLANPGEYIQGRLKDLMVSFCKSKTFGQILGEEISSELQQKLGSELEEYGLKVVKVSIISLQPTEEEWQIINETKRVAGLQELDLERIRGIFAESQQLASRASISVREALWFILAQEYLNTARAIGRARQSTTLLLPSFPPPPSGGVSELLKQGGELLKLAGDSSDSSEKTDNGNTLIIESDNL